LTNLMRQADTKKLKNKLFQFYEIQNELNRNLNFEKEDPSSISSNFLKKFNSIPDIQKHLRLPGNSEKALEMLQKGFTDIYCKAYEAVKATRKKNAKPEDFHELRKKEKVLLYSFEYTEKLFPFKNTHISYRHLLELSEVLGRHHDLHILNERIKHEAKSGRQISAKSMNRFLNDLMRDLEDETVMISKHLFQKPPDKFASLLVSK